MNALSRKQQDNSQRQGSRSPERPSRINKNRESPPLKQQQQQQQQLAFPISGGSLFAKDNPFAQDYPSSVETETTSEPLAKKKRRDSSSMDRDMKSQQQSDVDTKEGKLRQSY